jgi:hypothetical protein
MTNTLNIASNDDTIFFSVDKNNITNDLIAKVNEILQEQYRKRLLIPYVSDEEQAELEAILNSLTDEDKEIVRTEICHLEINGDSYLRV